MQLQLSSSVFETATAQKNDMLWLKMASKTILYYFKYIKEYVW